MEILNKWFEHWEPLWLFGILLAEWATGLYQRNREFKYDEAKDLKKQKRTKTKKTTTEPSGASVIEETETVEETGDKNGTKGE